MKNRIAQPTWRGSFANCALLLTCSLSFSFAEPVVVWAQEPIDIGQTPQLFVDDYLVDNRYAIRKWSTEQVLRKFHTPVKHGSDPVLDGIGVHPTVRHDPEANLFRMWYKVAIPLVVGDRVGKGRLMGHYHVRYAESKDGVNWTLPNLGLYELDGNKNNNICFAHPKFDQMIVKEKGRGTYGISSPFFLEEEMIPEADRGGYKYLMTYTLAGGGEADEERNQVYLIGSKDGIHWDREKQVSLGMYGIADGWFGMVHDPRQQKYVGYVRPRDRYHRRAPNAPSHQDFDPGDFVYTGIVRRIARVESKELRKPWEWLGKTVFLPDAEDKKNGVTAHMGIGMKYYAGVYFGYLVNFVPKQKMWTELVISRDGWNFERSHEMVIPTGAEGSWDSEQNWAPAGWVEVWDEWWIYYFGANRPPNTPVQEDTRWGLGLAKIRKEGLVSLRTPDVGGMVVTKLVTWPGGELFVNSSMADGEMRVRISDEKRISIEGFDFQDLAPVVGDSVSHPVKWNGRSMEELKGKSIRLEFFFSNGADLFSFRAGSESEKGSTHSIPQAPGEGQAH